MSLSKKTPFKCPACGRRISVNTWISVNVSINPELKTQILDGTFGEGPCPFCGAEGRFLSPFLYHDQQKKIMVGVMSDFTSAMKNQPKPIGYRLRTVKDLGSLIEKILIFDDGMDDRLIELIKGCMRAQIHENNVEMLYAGRDGKKMFFEMPNDRQRVSIKRDVYHRAEKMFQLPKDHHGDKSFLLIDQSFAEKIFANP